MPDAGFTVPAVLDARAQQFGDRVMMSIAGTPVTFAQMRDRSCAAAVAFSAGDERATRGIDPAGEAGAAAAPIAGTAAEFGSAEPGLFSRTSAAIARPSARPKRVTFFMQSERRRTIRADEQVIASPANWFRLEALSHE
jgi:hypothetical protein